MQGIYNIVPTPFDEAGAIDELSLRRLIDFVIETGIDGLTILGFLGEAAKLTEGERAQVIDVTVEVAAGRVPVVVGATAPALDPCLRNARDAVSRGAAGLLVAPPRTNRPAEVAVRRHYEALADAVDVPIVVQDFPASSGVFMTPAFIGDLAREVPACRWLKLEDDPTAQKVTAILAANPDVRIFGGLGGNFMLEELQRGVVGMMTGFGFPEILVKIYRDFRAGEIERARDTFYRYLPLIRYENQAGLNLPLRKHIYMLRGAMDHAAPRRPYPPLDDITLTEVQALIDHLGLTVPGLVAIE
ncbi:MAG: dihydrodipicolinate synthase family protein [Candidatus Limnocylindrales bacterium]